eukprot:scaffold114171_cov43-Phaeocystis_antarctica.AAC.2
MVGTRHSGYAYSGYYYTCTCYGYTCSTHRRAAVEGELIRGVDLARREEARRRDGHLVRVRVRVGVRVRVRSRVRLRVRVRLRLRLRLRVPGRDRHHGCEARRDSNGHLRDRRLAAHGVAHLVGVRRGVGVRARHRVAVTVWRTVSEKR